MNKLIPLFLGLMLPLASFAQQDTPTMDAANQTIINACQAEGGVTISHKDEKCEYIGCAYIGTNGAVNFKGNNERVTGGCNLNDYRNKAKRAYKDEINKAIEDEKAKAAQRIKDLEDKGNAAKTIGLDGRNPLDVNGDGEVDENDDINGDGEVDEKDIEEARKLLSKKNSKKETQVPDPNAVYDENANVIGKVDGTIRIEECEFDLHPGHPCYKKCVRRDGFLGIFGERKVVKLERKACLKCLAGFQIYPLGPDGKAIGVVSIKVKCDAGMTRDANGKCIRIGGSNSGNYSTGNTNHGGANVNTGSNQSTGFNPPGGAGSVDYSISGGAGGGVQLPAYCDSKKEKDMEKCDEWMQVNKRFLCSSSSNPALCMGGDYNDITSRYSLDGCVNCQIGGRQRQSTLSGIAEIAGAVLPPLAMFGSAYVGAKAYENSNKAWAGAAVKGFEQCALDHNNYYQYLSANEAPSLTPYQQQNMNCNGYSLNSYAGLQNPYMGGYYGAGYTPGFMGGMMGPYGAYNPYGGGMMNGGMMAGGVMIAGGYSGGMMTGGYPGGYMNGGMMTGGYPGGYMTGGGYLAGGIAIAGGYNGGYMNGGYMNGGYMNGGYMNGGYMAGGYMAGGYSAGGYNGGYMAGGYNGGYMDYASSAQAANYDRMMQQQGMAYQVGMSGGGYNSGYYGASGFPSNIGLNIGAGVSWGGGGWM